MARQFLTSICDILRITGHKKYLYPRKHQQLSKRVVRDLKFWRRFITPSSKMGFKYILGVLPANNIKLASDACTSYGMAGVLTFDQHIGHKSGVDGLFWQINWVEWAKFATMPELAPGSVKINIAEFIAALITCETYAEYCAGKITTLEIDNITAKAWLDNARCTRAPYDRCAQGSHMHRLGMNIKIKTSWIPSAQNLIADICSRVPFKVKNKGQSHIVAGQRYRRISPKFNNLLIYFK